MQVDCTLGVIAEQHAVGIGWTLVFFVDVSVVFKNLAFVSRHEGDLWLLVARVEASLNRKIELIVSWDHLGR